MATKEKFDMVVLTFGYQKYILPRDVAMQFFNICVGHDIYKYDTAWENSEAIPYAAPIEQEAYPGINTIGPAHFHQMLENHKMREARKREETKKAAA